MGLLAKIFGAVPREEMSGIRLDMTHPFWEVSGETDFPSLLTALPHLLPEECVLYFEGGSPSGELLEFLQAHGVPERAHVAYGTIWPKPTVFHLPATPETMSRLAELTRSCAYPELAIHLHVYRDQSVLLEWHDAFTQPMLLSGEFPEQRVKKFAESLHMSYKKGVGAGQQPLRFSFSESSVFLSLLVLLMTLASGCRWTLAHNVAGESNTHSQPNRTT